MRCEQARRELDSPFEAAALAFEGEAQTQADETLEKAGEIEALQEKIAAEKGEGDADR